MSQSPLAWPSVGGPCSQLSSRRWLPPLRALLQRRRGVLTPILTVTGSQRGLPYPVESVQGPPLPRAHPGLRAASRPNASKLWPFSPMGSEAWSPQPWSPDKRIAVLETTQVSPPNCQVPPSTLTLSQRRRADNGQQRATPGSPASGRSPDQPRPSLLPLGSCKGVQHAPPNPGPGQSPGTADHPRPTNPIPPPRDSKDLRR